MECEMNECPPPQHFDCPASPSITSLLYESVTVINRQALPQFYRIRKISYKIFIQFLTPLALRGQNLMRCNTKTTKI